MPTEHEDLKEIVIELRADVHNMAKSQQQLADSVSKLVDMQTEQEILKRDVHYKHEINVNAISMLSEKVDKTIENCAESKKEFTSYKELMRPIEFLLKNPKVGLFFIVLIYLFAIQEVRTPILKALGWS